MTAFSVILGYAFCALLALFPLICVWIAQALAKRWGCTVHEGGAGPCIHKGKDREPLLYRLFMMGWLLMFTVPLALILAIVFTVRWW